MCVLPKNSHYLLPSPFSHKLFNQFKEYYPSKFVVDTSGKRREWEGIVLVGMINVEKIKEYHKQNKKDIDRKGLMLERVDDDYVYKYNEFKNESVFKSYYGDIQSNKVVRQIL